MGTYCGYIKSARNKVAHYLMPQVEFALRDVQETQKIWQDTQNDYTMKLQAEFDALVERKQVLVRKAEKKANRRAARRAA